MRHFVDLHTHSIASDGAVRPSEVVRLAEGRRLAAVALTDHDTLEGLAEAQAAAAEFPSIKFVPGVEVSARFVGGTLHILGLMIDPAAPALNRLVTSLQDARNQRNPRMIVRLRELGLDVTIEEAQALAARGRRGGEGCILGRLHVAALLQRKGYVKTTDEAFEKYIGSGCPAYIEKDKLDPAETIRAIRDSGGVAVLAHPPQLNCTNRAQLERVVRSLVHDGLDGIEAYHTDNSPLQTREYLALARRFGLEVSGGSDFHGRGAHAARLGLPRVPLAALTGRLGAFLKR